MIDEYDLFDFKDKTKFEQTDTLLTKKINQPI